MSIGRARAWGAASIINAIPDWRGGAFAIGLETRARVEVGGDLHGITATAWGMEERVDTRLIRSAVQDIIGDRRVGAHVEVESGVPPARGLKSSSAAANAVVAATLRALGRPAGREQVVHRGVRAARQAGVTITGAYDDATASMMGGYVLTDNRRMRVLRRGRLDRRVLLLIPPKRAYTAHTPVARLRAYAPASRHAFTLAMGDRLEEAMLLNGLLTTQALGAPLEPLLEALQRGVQGASLSGTGPAYAALLPRRGAPGLARAWKRWGKVLETRVQNTPGGPIR
ncbi:MAG: shikimate kinase [Euryarchaeota archaeon]|nr:shikimate kinase [Euryarchaeota archaeon]